MIRTNQSGPSGFHSLDRFQKGSLNFDHNRRFGFWAYLVSALVLLAATVPARAATYSTTYNSGTITDGRAVPDGGGALNTLSSSVNVNLLANNITDISVTLNISGGFNGDLYGYLRGPNGAIAVLINRVGVTSTDPIGYGNTGFNITINDANGSHDIHYYNSFLDGTHTINGSGQVTGVWQSDGRNHDPATVTGDGSSQNATLSSIENASVDPNGTWTLVFGDMVSGGGASTLVSWSLSITAVPEPVAVALGIFGVVGGGAALLRRRMKRRESQA
jgi:subtilisin-like proprotein convertase family protein